MSHDAFGRAHLPNLSAGVDIANGKIQLTIVDVHPMHPATVLPVFVRKIEQMAAFMGGNIGIAQFVDPAPVSKRFHADFAPRSGISALGSREQVDGFVYL